MSAPLSTAPRGHLPVSPAVKAILWVDCGGALLVGGLMWVLADWLLALYRMPPSLFFAIATANLVYGCYSLSLALRRRRPQRLISALAVANAVWGCVCVVGALLLVGRASILGVATLLLEAAVVFTLAWWEWRYRAVLTSR